MAWNGPVIHEIDVVARRGGDRAADGDVAAVAGDVAAARVAGVARDLVVGDAVLEHVARVRLILRRPVGVGGHRADARHRAIGVDDAQPVVVGDRLRGTRRERGDEDRGADDGREQAGGEREANGPDAAAWSRMSRSVLLDHG